MSWIRTELEQALQELLVAVEHAAHFYEALAGSDLEDRWGPIFKHLVDEREALASELERAVKSEGDLPTVPDPDRETLQLWMQELEVLVSEDQRKKAVEEAIAVEDNLLSCLEQAQKADKAHLHGKVFQMVRDSYMRVQKALADLQKIETNRE